jgi:dihydrofolate reductase
MPPCRVYNSGHPFGTRSPEVNVSASVLYMSRSLDGYIAGPNDEPGHPGDDFDRLHEWFGDFSRLSGPVGELFDEMNAYGAILVGRRTAEQIDHWGGDRHGDPIFVPSHRPPDPSVARVRAPFKSHVRRQRIEAEDHSDRAGSG